jgi:leader peptidase (prepilin peptidase)/N-methyltransferase
LIGTGGSFGGAVLTALPYYIAAFFSNRMGSGDIKLMFACGAVLGIWGGAAQTIIGLSFAGLFGLLLKFTKGQKAKETSLPLAPFLCAGGIASYILTEIGGIFT